jgi:hypothetical protein
MGKSPRQSEPRKGDRVYLILSQAAPEGPLTEQGRPTMPQPRKLTRDKMFREMTSRWAPFPNVDGPLGAYDYFSQTVSLGSVNADRFAAAFRDRDFHARLEVFPLLIHELQHFADHVSTVWGRNLLVRLFNVYTARMSGALNEYWRIPEMMRELKTAHFDDYYTDVTDAALEPSDGSPWQYTFSTGFQLDSSGRRREDRPSSSLSSPGPASSLTSAGCRSRWLLCSKFGRWQPR